MSHWPRAGLVALVQELYRLSDDNRNFLHARLLPEQAGRSRDDIKRKLERLLTPQVVYNGKFSHTALKRVIDQFEKATDDPAAVADLILADIDEALDTFAYVGDFEPIVDHVYAMMQRLEKLLKQLGKDEARPVVTTLSQVAARWDGKFGYGVSDELMAMASDWQEWTAGASDSR
jgi:hypothetical protein